MDINEATALLGAQLCNFDWFYGVEKADDRKVIVYTTYQNHEVYKTIPEKIDNYHVCVHFAAAKTVKHLSKDLDQNIEYNYLSLSDELFRLRQMCNEQTLEDIFYELHDGKNAITNCSDHYPNVRKTLELLYDRYGFDVLFEELGLE